MTEPASPVLSTERLILRRWRESDRELFACLNADPEVMRHFLRPLTREESDAFVDRIEARFDERGYGLRAIRVMERIGLHRDPRDDFDYPNMPEGHPLRRHLLYRLKREE